MQLDNLFAPPLKCVSKLYRFFPYSHSRLETIGRYRNVGRCMVRIFLTSPLAFFPRATICKIDGESKAGCGQHF